jgi:L-ascorbate metabolism protein UlaG (beta-lactamase superfamily)
MEITWLGHSCFRLRGRDVVVVSDPYGGDDWRLPPLSTAADVVTISNDHPHHSNAAAVRGAPRVLKGPGEYEIRGAMIWGIRTVRAPAASAAGGSRNTSFVIQFDDVTVCHLGDLGQPLTAEQLTHLKDCDVLLVPVGGHCTIDAAQAVEVVAQIEPKIVVPMHYGTEDTGEALRLDAVERFCREMGATEVTPQGRLNVTASSLPEEATVVLLEARR